MSSTNRGAERVVNDAYYTPDILARALVGTLDIAPSATVWEPHAGGGAFVRALGSRRIFASDLDRDAPMHDQPSARVRYLAVDWDALRGWPWLLSEPSPEWIVGNPPFTEAEAHARMALRTATVGVAFLLRLAFLEGKGRIPFWRDHPAARVYVLAERPSFTGGKTDSCAYGWFVWDKRYSGPTQLHHLSWR